MPKAVYLDNNATAPLRQPVIKSMMQTMMDCGNASSIHGFGRKARLTIEQAREDIADFIGVKSNQLIFTSGGTESNNLALQCVDAKRVLVSAVEHDSVRLVRKDADIIPVDENGIVRLDELDKMLAALPGALVSVMLANNETGVIQPMQKIAEICKKHGALLHTDAVQALGKMPVNFSALGVDLMTLSAHKSGGPQGIGVLAFTGNVAMTAMIRGGGQERFRRAGTENVAAIAGFGALIQELNANMDGEIARMMNWRIKIENQLHDAGFSTVAGIGADRLPNTICAIWPKMKSEMQLMRMDMAGVAVSAGSACSSGKIKPSHVLAAMGCDAEAASGAIRVSMGWNTADRDIQEFLASYLALGAPLGKTQSESKLKIA